MISASSLDVLTINHYMIELFLRWPVQEENPVKLFKVALNCNVSEGWVLSIEQ